MSSLRLKAILTTQYRDPKMRFCIKNTRNLPIKPAPGLWAGWPPINIIIWTRLWRRRYQHLKKFRQKLPRSPHTMKQESKPDIEVWGGIECTINRVNDQYFDQLGYAGHYS